MMAQTNPDIDQLRQLFLSRLDELYPEREIRAIFDLLMQHYSGLPSHELSMKRREVPEAEVRQSMETALERLDNGEPVQHITGVSEFCGLKIGVGPEVLIPRPETEELVHWVLDDLAESPAGRYNPVNSDAPASSMPPETFRILDVGTGSGCIALALKHYLPQARVSGLDVSAAALERARQNAAWLKLETDFYRHDILADSHPSVPGRSQGGYRVIISNPPYVPASEKFSLPLNVRGSDPESALFVPDDDPLIFYRHIVKFAMQHLEPEGGLYLEIHEIFGKEVCNLLAYNGLKEVQLRQDIHGKDRMVKGTVK